MRLLARLLGCVVMLVSGCGGPNDGMDLPRPTSGLELRGEDLAQARESFRTRLNRHGPPPGQPVPLPVISDAEIVEYESDGLRLKTYRSRPAAGATRTPAVLFLHGGFAFGEAHWQMALPFREAGFAVMIPVLRGENGQPGDFSLFGDEVGDVLAAADILATAPDVDARNVFVAGHSVGGTLATLAAMTSRRFRAAASLSGSPDLDIYLKASRTAAPFDPTSIAEIRLRSAVAHATSFRCPARLYYGDEEIWLQSSTRRTALLASGAGLDVAAVELPGDHFSSVPRGIREAVAFFRRHLVAD